MNHYKRSETAIKRYWSARIPPRAAGRRLVRWLALSPLALAVAKRNLKLLD